MPKLIDAHTHVQFAAYKDDIEETINRALKENIWLVNVGTQKETSAKAVEIAEKYDEGVYATVGLHPIHTEKSFHDSQELGNGEKAKRFTPLEARAKGAADAIGVLPLTGFTSRGEQFDYDYYKKLGENPKVVAIGECGLDYYRATSNKQPETRKLQKDVFIKHIELAKELGKPLMIHCRDAYADSIDVLVACRMSLVAPAPGIIHFFSGTKEDAKELLDFGFYFSFGGVVTFVRDYDVAIKYIGLERIVLETDAPYVTPTPHRGKRNEPAYVKYVAEKLAEILEKSVEEVAETTTKNTREILRI